MLSLMVRRRAQRAVSNTGSRFGPAAIVRDALASLGLLRMRSQGLERFIASEDDGYLPVPADDAIQAAPPSLLRTSLECLICSHRSCRLPSAIDAGGACAN